MIDPNEQYKRQWEAITRDPRGFVVFQEPINESGTHPESFIDFECAFAARHIRRAEPKKILDVGSYRHFVLGLLAHYSVTTVDVRSRRTTGENEILLTCDAKKITLPDDSFDLVLSLCALEHFGLGRYGDEFDLEADQKAIREMIRVLKPARYLIFTTTITRCQPAIAFNAHRIYNHGILKTFCADLICIEEKFYSHRMRSFCSLEEITNDPQGWDVYLGCWKKKGKGKG